MHRAGGSDSAWALPLSSRCFFPFGVTADGGILAIFRLHVRGLCYAELNHGSFPSHHQTAKKNILNSIIQRVVLMFLMGSAGLFHRSGDSHQTGCTLVAIWTILLLTFLDIALSHVRKPRRKKMLEHQTPRFPACVSTTANFVQSSCSIRCGLSRGIFLGVPTDCISLRGGAFPQLHQRHDDSCLRDGNHVFCNWVWGRMADPQGWHTHHRGQRASFLLWLQAVSHHTPTLALLTAPVLQCIATAGSSANAATLNMEYASCQRNRIPRRGEQCFNLMGYIWPRWLLQGIQSTLEHSNGTRRSISVLFCHQRRRDVVPVGTHAQSAKI